MFGDNVRALEMESGLTESTEAREDGFYQHIWQAARRVQRLRKRTMVCTALLVGGLLGVAVWRQLTFPASTEAHQIGQAEPANPFRVTRNSDAKLGIRIELKEGGQDVHEFNGRISEVGQGTWAEMVGVQEGDILLQLNSDFTSAMKYEEIDRATVERPKTWVIGRPTEYLVIAENDAEPVSSEGDVWDMGYGVDLPVPDWTFDGITSVAAMTVPLGRKPLTQQLKQSFPQVKYFNAVQKLTDSFKKGYLIDHGLLTKKTGEELLKRVADRIGGGKTADRVKILEACPFTADQVSSFRTEVDPRLVDMLERVILDTLTAIGVEEPHQGHRGSSEVHITVTEADKCS